jgi:hypothetical protein
VLRQLFLKGFRVYGLGLNPTPSAKETIPQREMRTISPLYGGFEQEIYYISNKTVLKIVDLQRALTLYILFFVAGCCGPCDPCASSIRSKSSSS